MMDKPFKDSAKDKSSTVPLRLQRIMYCLRRDLVSFALQLKIDTTKQVVVLAKKKYLDLSAHDSEQLIFCELQLREHSVSFYLYPLREHKELLRDLSPELHARFRGDCCFNFVGVDEILFQELSQLTAKLLGLSS